MVVGENDRVVLERIEELLDAPSNGVAAPTLASMEETLTEGYAEALALEAERLRVERRLGEVAGTAHEPSAAAELAALARRLTHADVELGKLRAVLGRLQARTNADSVQMAFLASEENYRVVRDLEVRNLIVPVVGDFAGPKAIRAVGDYLKKRRLSVQAFYLSNVEQYLNQQGSWNNFCASVASMPLDETSTFIRSGQGGFGYRGGGLRNSLGSMTEETRGCAP